MKKKSSVKRKKSPVKIGIDIDNVISDSYPAYLEKFNRLYGTSIEIEEIKEFYYLNEYIEKNKHRWGRQVVNFIGELVYDESFQLNLPPINEAVEVIGDWLMKGYRIHYITSRPNKTRQLTLKWLRNNGFWKKHCRLDLYDEKGPFATDTEYKVKTAQKYGLNVFIEDALEIARAMKMPVFLMDRPWNQGKINGNIIRVDSFSGIKTLLPQVLEEITAY